MSGVADRPSAGDGLAATLARSWFEVLVAPRRFFRERVVPGDQAPGLLFAMGVVLIVQSTRAATGIAVGPGNPGSMAAQAFWIAVAVLFVTPAALHLIAAFQTVLLIPLASDRGGVSETVQILAYAAAPCALAGVPSVELRALVGLYAAALLAIGLSTVHRIGLGRSLLVGAVPAFLSYGLGFGAVDAITTLLARWYII
ncbi:YIP1 family protein [Natronoarchaeum philippinense]|uniref:YIP1 family protein n=1 Tax=Natronoarchaeum philippinense TaxID=558529 RepID=UPI001FE29ED3|nr:YIP1 family protein [Natronoarchaeum philippinense]